MNDINIHLDKINNADKIFEEIKKGYIYPNFLDYKNKKVSSTSDEKYIHLRTRGSISNKSQIYFSCSTRSKNINRILLKMLANSQYTTSN
ncbi:TPA: hypothetical protein DEP21_00060 [Patescibacteria group bacterium]|nr:hypothetical protein [Candidatus Gracilibacteria bacterium]